MREPTSASPADDRHLALEAPEVLLSWPPMVRYLDARILQAVRPWSRLLYSEDFAAIRMRAYQELALDPVLRGLLTRLARELVRHRKDRGRSLARSRPKE